MMTAIIQNFKNYLYQLGYCTKTQKSVSVLVQEFLEHQNITDISYIEQQELRSFFEYLPTRPLQRRSGALSEATIHRYIFALKVFFSWMERTEQINYNPISGMRFKQPKKNARQPLSTPEIQQLFMAATTLQQQAVLHLFYSCGLRRGEGEDLNIADIHFKDQLLYVRAGKGNKRRVIPLTKKVAEDLEQYYLQDRCGHLMQVKDVEAFMLNNRGTRMKAYNFMKLLQQLTCKASLPKEISLHHLRHSIATHLLQGGMAVEYVKDFLGHSCLVTTHIYAKPRPSDVQLL
ncbi:MAG: tyrosine-type recombinase/integrase [Chitinophagaceae bacterium]|nr:tyrosine-type recombinase/integrase [Chitinophagaceae bacterium]